MILYTPYCNLIKTPFAYPILIAPSMQINESFQFRVTQKKSQHLFANCQVLFPLHIRVST